MSLEYENLGANWGVMNPNQNWGVIAPSPYLDLSKYAPKGIGAIDSNYTFSNAPKIGIPSLSTPQAAPGMFGGLFDNFFGRTNADGSKEQGWGGTALGVAQGLGNAYMGMKQYGLSKDIFNENKRQFNLNYDNQKILTNDRLKGRQEARVASNPGAYQSVADYMKTNKIGG